MSIKELLEKASNEIFDQVHREPCFMNVDAFGYIMRAYAKVHDLHLPPGENTIVEVETPYNGGDENILIMYYRTNRQLVCDNPAGVRLCHTGEKLFASCDKFDKRFENKKAAFEEMNQKLREKN